MFVCVDFSVCDVFVGKSIILYRGKGESFVEVGVIVLYIMFNCVIYHVLL